jgi:hypothetical protein
MIPTAIIVEAYVAVTILVVIGFIVCAVTYIRLASSKDTALRIILGAVIGFAFVAWWMWMFPAQMGLQ